MLVYANWFKVYGPDTDPALFKAVGSWLKKKTGYGLHPEKLVEPGIEHYKNDGINYSLKISSTDSEYPKLYSWRLQHSDPSVQGRQWIVEVGIKLTEDFGFFSCVLRTDEQSALIDDPVIPSRPNIVSRAIRNVEESRSLQFDTNLPGLSTKGVGESEDSYKGLLHEIERENRNYPIVIVSPDTNSKHWINPAHLQDALIGLAQVVKVHEDYDRPAMESILGRRFSAWGGAVNVINTPNRSGRIRSRYFLSDEIASWGDTQQERVARVLAWVTNHTNVSRQREHVRPEGVRLLELERRKQDIRSRTDNLTQEELKHELEEVYSIADEERKSLEEEKRIIQEELDSKSVELAEATDALSQKDYEIESLKHRLQDAGQSRGSQLDVDRLMAVACGDNEPSPVDCLDIIESLFGDRCVVLESAKKSAQESEKFARGRKLLDLLWRLVTEYRDELRVGGDARARHVFGASTYAAKESETVVNNKKLIQARTFEYRGQPVEMLRHLKIGMEDDLSKTIRVHFYWDDQREMIVIGYCGEHLPVPTH